MRQNEVSSYRPQPYQQEIHRLIGRTKYSWIQGGFRSGKTIVALQEDIDACMRVSGMSVLITRKFHEDLIGSIKPDFYELCDPRLISYTQNSQNICHFKNGSFVQFQGLYTKSNMQRSKLGGHEFGRIHGEEADEFTVKDHLDLQGRISSKRVPDHERKIYYTTNPPNTDHWAHGVFETGKRPGFYDIIKVSTRQNRFLPTTYIADLEESYGRQPGWLSRYFDGQWGFTPKGDPVFNWDEIYIDESISFNRGWPIYRLWDFGWHHPAVLWLQIGADRDVNILLESLGSKIYLKNYAPTILKMTNDEFPNAEIIDICDDAGKQHKDDGRPSIEILEDADGPFKLSMRYRQSYIQEGIELIEGKMREMVAGRPALRVKASRCPILVEGFRGGYCRDGDDIIKDGYYEHLMDALREGMVNIFGSNGRDVSHESSSGDVEINQPSYGFGKQRTIRTETR